ncbi:MAG: MerR family transcriptional regulator [Coriobacteriaceae bacterium]|jgi:DNA-binding transcriptional MerR regulator|uniref:transcriptional regulator FtsR n=1 Tax=Atopobium sp. oral taxon 416 TaxID=712157 RepID=UPI000FEDE0DD|nr:MerR family transcriptional regulator [Atopobium sp. oral taxon 416]QUC02144.1 MerR family transcriptional regulator [Atopobium sp. oral taxon 416]RRF99070.1 MAG: MerR family transcriptional regulator [Coriobacteriaceae bacterium]
MTDAGYLTIGKVVKRLQNRYPDLSVSKVRYLEDEGLLNPARTPGGYRLYSPRDVKRLETILYLQKTRFLPLSVIKEELERQDRGESVSPERSFAEPGATQVAIPQDDQETINKLHPIDKMPELTGAPVSFVRQLADAGIIVLKKSPHGRDLVDGKDFKIIRCASRLRHYGIGPRNLRMYAFAANREEGMFEQSLGTLYAKKGNEPSASQQREFADAVNEMLALTDTIRDTLIRRMLQAAFKDMDVDDAGKPMSHESKS